MLMIDGTMFRPNFVSMFGPKPDTLSSALAANANGSEVASEIQTF